MAWNARFIKTLFLFCQSLSMCEEVNNCCTLWSNPDGARWTTVHEIHWPQARGCPPRAWLWRKLPHIRPRKCHRPLPQYLGGTVDLFLSAGLMLLSQHIWTWPFCPFFPILPFTLMLSVFIILFLGFLTASMHTLTFWRLIRSLIKSWHFYLTICF